jgi:glycosyltransferase involved in cell wall biosynthesis
MLIEKSNYENKSIKIQNSSPEISILVLTYNRRNLLERNLNSIFSQTFDNYEILLLDDCSIDNTEEFVRSIKDERIRYFRNDVNLGKEYGDWWAIRKAIYELAKGKYFIYLCDDDYWAHENVLKTLVEKFYEYPNLSFAFGMHAHIYPERRLVSLNEENIFNKVKNCYTTKKMFPEGYISGLRYLHLFSKNPCGKNYLEGGTLFSIEKFKNCGAFFNKTGTKWQAGYMFKMGMAVVGDVYFIDEPYVIATVSPNAQSFSRTQRDHFYDIVHSIGDSYKGVKKSDVFNLGGTDLERTKVFEMYKKTMRQFILSWLSSYTATKKGSSFIHTPASYFKDYIRLKDLMYAARYLNMRLTSKIVSRWVYSRIPSILFRKKNYTI